MINQNGLFLFNIISIIILVVIFNSRFFSFLDKNEFQRDEHLDGLRFFLAIAVAFHHMVYSYNWSFNNDWNIEHYPISKKLGRFGVCLFFMLSAYFMTRRNITNVTDLVKFYIKRFFRIAPVAWLSASLCIMTALIFGSAINYHNLIDNLFFWFDFGLTLNKPDINSFDNMFLINTGVMWTLHWEWLLYFSLPIIYIVREKLNNFIVSQCMNFTNVFVVSYFDQETSNYLLCFSLGMTVRDLVGKIKLSNNISSVIVLLAIVLIFVRHASPLSTYSIIIESVIFFLICNGCDIFGLLKVRGAVRLGEVSYSIYLLHGIMWFYMNKMLVGHDIGNISYLGFSFATVLLTCLLSCVSFMLLEQKGINLGKKISTKIC
ncbi:acyltransferase family protein [Aristophania vespae]|uniref:acyltransferase family protein n=1 Tax=Aristophania vespae TaxID=2697033 RepID=UPI0023519140|nr:acyltransferase [Aristophania vespae]UMM64410.1 hypothetical protein DM15PD_14240 [Aristophania vespae]